MTSNTIDEHCIAKNIALLIWRQISIDLAMEVTNLAIEVSNLAIEVTNLAIEVTNLAIEVTNLAI